MKLKNKKIAVIGAGFAGITIANDLSKHNQVTIFDKSRGIGGRMATRRIGDYHFDHGAQYFTARSAEFRELCKAALTNNIIAKWPAEIANFSSVKNEDKFVAKPQMNSFCKYLAKDLDVKLNHKLIKISHNNNWQLEFENNLIINNFEVLIIAIPSNQAVDLLPKDFSQIDKVKKIQMLPCYSLMLGLRAKPKYEFSAASLDDNIIKWFAFNNLKEARPNATALVVNTSNEWAKENLELEDNLVIQKIISNLNKYITIHENNIEVTSLQRWRFANSIKSNIDKSYFDSNLNIGLCGDWLISGRVESAFLSAKDLFKKINK